MFLFLYNFPSYLHLFGIHIIFVAFPCYFQTCKMLRFHIFFVFIQDCFACRPQIRPRNQKHS